MGVSREWPYRALTLWLASTLVGLAVAGCGSSGSDSSDSSVSAGGSTKPVPLKGPAECNVSPTTDEMMAFRAPKAKREYDITLMEVSLSVYDYQALAWGATKAARDAGVNLTIVGGRGYGTAADQVTQGENVLTRGTDGIVMTPADVNGSVPLVNMAAERDVPVVVAFSEINSPKAISVNQDDYLQGEVAARTLQEYVPTGDGIVQAGPAEATWAVRRTNGLLATLKEDSSGPQAGAVTNQLVDPAEGLKDFTNALGRVPEADWVYAVANTVLQPASIPAKYRGRIFYLAGGYDPATIPGLRDGSIKAVLPDNSVWQGYMSVSRLVSQLNGDPPPRRTCLPNQVYTKKDVGSREAESGNIKPDDFTVG